MITKADIGNSDYRMPGVTDEHMAKAYALMEKHDCLGYDQMAIEAIRTNATEPWCPFTSYRKSRPLSESLFIDLSWFFMLAEERHGKVRYDKRHNYWHLKVTDPEITWEGSHKYVRTDWYITFW